MRKLMVPALLGLLAEENAAAPFRTVIKSFRQHRGG